MSFEAISSITGAEAAAKAAVAAAETKARQMLADAEAAGRAVLEAAGTKADSELSELRRKAGEKSREEADELSRQLEEQKTALRSQAEGKLADAAALIVERIVNN